MATTHVNGGPHYVLSVKGAPEQVLAMCDRWLDQDGVRPLDSDAAADIIAANATMAARGLRVLGLAYTDPAEDAQRSGGLT
jgi:magnesium-transporting ATPase (P-type)